MTASNGNISRVTGHLCGEFTGHRWILHTKAIDAELWCFLRSAPWINGWVNNREAGDLRYHRARYDVIVMQKVKPAIREFHCAISTKTYLFDNVLISGWVRSVLLCNTCNNDVCVEKVSYVYIQHALLNGVNSGVYSTLYQSLSAFMILTPLPQCRIYASVNRVSVVSDNGLSPIRRKAII